MKPIPTVRAAHLIGFVELLRDIGTPVERDLEMAGLPPSIEKTPDALISDILAMSFIGTAANREGIEDIGWLGVKRLQLSFLSNVTNEGLAPQPTVLGRLRSFFELIKVEDSSIHGGFLVQGNKARVWMSESRVEQLEPLYVSEWYVIGLITEIARTVLGPDWCPIEIAFRSKFNIAQDALERFPNTRFQFGQSHTSILMPRALLAASPELKGFSGSGDHAKAPPPIRFDDQLRPLIRPYLSDTVPSIQLAAEIADTSVRTFQRRLEKAGLTYSELVDQVRFEAARAMLLDGDAKTFEIAQSVGYTSASNFSRAFRRLTGMSPRDYQNNH